MVHEMGLEPTRVSSHAPQTCASTIPPFVQHIVLYTFFKKSQQANDINRRKNMQNDRQELYYNS